MSFAQISIVDILRNRTHVHLRTNPTHLPICGQVCVAMIADMDILEAIAEFGHVHGTTTRQVVMVLRKLGWNCTAPRRRIVDGKLPQRGLLSIKMPGRAGWHWVVKWDEHIYDPVKGIDPNLEESWGKGTKFTSYLEIS